MKKLLCTFLFLLTFSGLKPANAPALESSSVYSSSASEVARSGFPDYMLKLTLDHQGESSPVTSSGQSASVSDSQNPPHAKSNSPSLRHLNKRDRKKIQRLKKKMAKVEERSTGKSLMIIGLLVMLVSLIPLLIGVAAFSGGMVILGSTIGGIGTLVFLAGVVLQFMDTM